MRHLVVTEPHPSTPSLTLQDTPLGPLAENEVRIDVNWSSLNYKDALASLGHRGVVRKLPLTPGIDAAGVVSESRHVDYRPGDEVLATGHDFGVARDGGWAEQLDAPGEQIVRLPRGLSQRDAMIFGTAGFTAVQCLWELQSRQITPDSGDILVTGATGGVGGVAVALLADAGFRVVASTGKEDRRDWLTRLGAAECVGREAANPGGDKPMLPARWAAAVDTVGGATLASVVKSLKPGGAVAACGVVAGPELDLTVYPFILRGVALIGVDSAWHAYSERLKIWDFLSSALSTEVKDALVHGEATLEEAPRYVEQILAGGICGRVLVRPKV